MVGGASEEKLSVSDDAKVSHVTASVCKIEGALLSNEATSLLPDFALNLST